MVTKRRIVKTKPTLDLGKVFGASTSPAVVAGGFVFCTGYLSIDGQTGKAALGTIEEETRRTLENLSTVLAAAGSSLDKVVKVNVFLANLKDFEGMNRVYNGFFPSEPPARRTVQAGLLGGYKVEIDCIAVV
jgi:2-iminobutanoate/2-iminopropanoate deaminase